MTDDQRDAERYREIGSIGMFWLQNREAILAAVEKAGFRLMSNQHGFWLAPVRAAASLGQAVGQEAKHG